MARKDTTLEPYFAVNISQFSSGIFEIYFFSLERAFIWSEWGSCNLSTCLQRRKRKCIDESACAELIEAGIDSTHADYIGAGWQKFERRCKDEADCFAAVTASDPMTGKLNKA